MSSITLPFYELSIEERRRLRQDTKTLLIKSLKMYFGGDDFTLRDLLPTDLGLSNWSVITGDTPWINISLQSSSSIGIYAFTILSDQSVSEMWVENGGTVTGLYQLEHCFGSLPLIKQLLSPELREVLDRIKGSESISPILGAPMCGYFETPIVTKGSSLLTIRLTSYSGTVNSYLVLSGYVAEQNGARIML